METKIGPASAAIALRIEASSLVGYELVSGEAAACITFADYMATCLYDKDAGYYRDGAARVGKGGDFYTSPALGDLMARAIAASVKERTSDLTIGAEELLVAEWGAGTGRLSAQLGIVLESGGEGSKGCRQLLIEDHRGHVAQIRKTYAELSATSQPEVWTSEEAWERSKSWLGGQVFLIANELLDAFPVHRVAKHRGELWELGVAGSEPSGYRYVRMPMQDNRLTEAMDAGGLRIAEGQIIEIGLAAGQWINRLGQAMSGGGRVLIIDYGDEGEELSGPHRMAGTLMTYRNHRASDSPFDQPGDRDLTAHVNFTAIRRAAENSGFRTVYYGTQKQFLVDRGVLDLLAEHDGTDPFLPSARRNRAIRQLLLSDGMSEIFKVLVLEK